MISIYSFDKYFLSAYHVQVQVLQTEKWTKAPPKN